MCAFEKLYRGGEGYMVRCCQCGHYQLAFGTSCLTLEADNWLIFQKMVSAACEAVNCDNLNSKSLSLATPYDGVVILLTGNELLNLRDMLDKADTEAWALSMLSLFNQPAP